MKLIYIYMEKFRNFQGQSVAFTASHRVRVESRDELAVAIYIERGEPDKFYQQNIHSIHAIVGRNATGKTNIADIIGMPWDSGDRTGVLLENAAYFLLYAVEDSDGEDIYYAEIVGLHLFAGIFELEAPAGPDHKLYDSWFRYDPVGHKLTEIRKADLPSSITENCTAILSLREKFGMQHYFKVKRDRYSFCGNYVRRVGHSYVSWDISDQVRVFWRITANKSFMQGKNQCLSVRCCMDYLDDGLDGKPPIFKIDYAHTLGKEEYLHLRIAEAWLKFLLETTIDKNDDMRDDLISYLEKNFSELPPVEKDTPSVDCHWLLSKYMDFAFEYMEIHAGWSKNYISETRTRFKHFSDSPLISCKENSFDICIGSKKIADFLSDIFDSGWAERGGFSKPLWTNTSDGEQAYLLTFTAIEKILDDANADCHNNIILMDEPEIHMHPDLSRQFVSELLKWLETHHGNRRYQIILITHSPFLLSDIERNNVQYIEKCEDGSVSIRRPNNQTFAANIHDILSDAIILDSPYGEFARQEIKTALKQLEKAEELNVEDTDKEVIKNTLQKLSHIVGEEVLARQLEFLGKSI